MKETDEELSMRQVFLLREQARAALRSFLHGVSDWPTRNEFPHFAGEKKVIETGIVSPLRTMTIPNSRSLIDKKGRVFNDKCPMIVVENGEETPSLPKLSAQDSSKYLGAFFQLLESMLPGKEKASLSDVEILLEALGHPLKRIVWCRGVVTFCEGARGCAEQLIAYVNIVSQCGLVHSACGDCRRLISRNAGDRKYCEDCSKKHQTYQYRKEYLLRKKREYYRRDVKEDQPFSLKSKSTKGVTRENAKKGK